MTWPPKSSGHPESPEAATNPDDLGSQDTLALSAEEDVGSQDTLASHYDQEKPSQTPEEAPSIPALRPIRQEEYQLLGEFARGGLGRIIKAHDARLLRPVAIKELLAKSSKARLRFLREALLTARLQHPAIVPIYEAGHWPTGEPFYAMKLVEGKSLAQVISQARTLRERLALLPHIIDVCDAIAYAHSKRIIHRDIKPANILIGEYGETVVIDWGLAKELGGKQDNNEREEEEDEKAGLEGEDAKGERAGAPPGASPKKNPAGRPFPSSLPEGLTVAGRVMGTPAYMPPEQAQGKAVDERADVYALGAILYETLSGVPPYQGETAQIVLSQILLGPPKPLEKIQPEVPVDLLAIVKKAMAPDPKDRYPTARELTEDIRRFSTGQLVGAHTYSSLELLRRFLHRNRAVVSAIAVSLLVLGLFALYSVGEILAQRDHAREKREEADRERKKAQQALLLAEQERARADLRADQLILQEAQLLLWRDPAQSVAWLKLLPKTSPLLSAARTVAADARARGISQILTGHQESITTLAFSPKGDLLASAGEDNLIKLWSLSSHKAETLSEHTGPVSQIAFSPDGSLLASASWDKTVRLWDIATGESRVIGSHKDWVLSLAFSPDGTQVAITAADGAITLFPLDGSPPRPLRVRGAMARKILFSPDGAWLASISANAAVRLFYPATGEERAFFCGQKGELYDLDISPDGKFLAAASSEHLVCLWDMETHALTTLPGHEDAVHKIAFSPDGTLLASASRDKTVRLFHLETKETRVLEGHRAGVFALAFSPDGAFLASAGEDQTVRLWGIAHEETYILRGHQDNILALAFSPDGAFLASAGLDRGVRLWEKKSFSRKILLGHEHWVYDLAFSPDGARLASASYDKTVRLWDIATGKSQALTGHRDTVYRVAFSPDGAQLASASWDGTVRLWTVPETFPASASAPTSQPASAPISVQVLEGHAGQIWSLAYSPDGTLLASADKQGTILLWDTKTGQRKAFLSQAGKVSSLAFSPDGRFLAFANEGVTISLLDLTQSDLSLEKSVSLSAPSPKAFSRVAFSPDGAHLLAAGPKGALLLWDMEREEGKELTGAGDDIFIARFSPDGTYLAAGDLSGGVYLWEVASKNLRMLRGHEDAITDLRFSPDGKTLASASQDKTARLWDVKSGQSRILRGHLDGLFALAFSPDGTRIATAGSDASIQLWADDLPREPAALHAYLQQATNLVVEGDLQNLEQFLIP